MILWQRLDDVSIERGASDPLLRHGPDKRVLIDERAARRIDEITARLHATELRFADQISVLGRGRGVEGEEIASGKQLIQRDKSHPEFLRLVVLANIVADQLHPEA